jgi:hypothetical protein
MFTQNRIKNACRPINLNRPEIRLHNFKHYV